MRLKFLLVLAVLLGLLAVNARAQYTLSLQPVVDGLSAPVAMAHAGDGSNRLFVVEQSGTIRIVKNGQLLPGAFLDIKSKLAPTSTYYSEMGLLGLAFHPNFKSNGKFYVHYSAPKASKSADHLTVIAQFQVSTYDPDMADFTSHRVILSVDQPASNHNGGTIAFGPDGYLYIGLGDGGGAGDRYGLTGNAQNLQSLLGKILRIDVDEAPYAIPPDNPFVQGGGRPEIYAYGLRNPWKFSFAPDGRLFVGDVGQSKFEEINIVTKGGNYGWRLMEGKSCYNPEKNCEQGKRLEPPIYTYPHNAEQISVIGGYYYRGKHIPALQRHYVFADWKGKVMALEAYNGQWQPRPIRFRNQSELGYVNSLGEDEEGNLYVLSQGQLGPKNRTGVLYLIQR
jgi:glucose/arabinose dehydrogenase